MKTTNPCAEIPLPLNEWVASDDICDMYYDSIDWEVSEL